MTVVVCEQPHYLPWLDFFEEAARADVLFVLDDVQWLRRGWQRRTRIARPPHERLSGRPGDPTWQWLTVPLADSSQHLTLRELALDPSSGWARRHLETLRHRYGARPHWRTQAEPLLTALYARHAEARGPGSVLALLVDSFRAFAAPLCLSPVLRFASEVPRTDEDRTGRLVQLCASVGGDVYYSGLGSVLYLKPGPFRANDTRLLWQNFRHPPWEQGFPGRPFVPGLSIVDAFSNVPVPTLREWLRPSPYGPFAAQRP